MKIAFNIRPLQNENKNRGTGSYTKSLLEALKKLSDKNLQILEFTNDVPDEADLVHYPFFDPFFLTLPIIKKKPSIVTVHDLIPLKFPDKFPRGLKGEIKWQIQKLSLQGANAVITDSVSSAQDIRELVGIKEEKIFPIPLAADAVFKPIANKSLLTKIKNKYRLPDKFILYVGDVNWNKNIVSLVRAFASSKVAMYKSIKLVLVGQSFLNNHLPEAQEISNTIKELGMGEFVLRLGFVSSEDLVSLYNLATLYVQPSFYEGFGLPVLEALSCGCLVVCANTSSLSEVGGNAVLYFDPYNRKDIVNKINTILHFDVSKHQSMIKKGIEQAHKFSWENTAKETLKIYEKVFRS